MTSQTAAQTIVGRLWLTGLVLTAAAMLIGAGAFCFTQTGPNAAAASEQSSDDASAGDFDAADPAASSGVEQQGGRPIQQALYVAAVLAICLPSLGMVVVGLSLAVLFACRRLLEGARRRTAENGKRDDLAAVMPIPAGLPLAPLRIRLSAGRSRDCSAARTLVG
ncbi:MAG TPA: hypothetical protein VMS17_05125 [Gemmataceae bacterium]|nr:hypothetical protein [Gemmataceae bacterium]